MIAMVFPCRTFGSASVAENNFAMLPPSFSSRFRKELRGGGHFANRSSSSKPLVTKLFLAEPVEIDELGRIDRIVLDQQQSLPRARRGRIELDRDGAEIAHRQRLLSCGRARDDREIGAARNRDVADDRRAVVPPWIV